MHPSWLFKLLRRYRLEGPAGLEPRSRRPKSSPSRIVDLYEDEIVALRKELPMPASTPGGHPPLPPEPATPPPTLGPHHLAGAPGPGLCHPQPPKRPKSSYTRFVADLPNERWQADMTHVPLPNGCVFEVLNIIDDHSRVYAGWRVAMPIEGLDIEVVGLDGSPLRRLVLDPTKDYQRMP